MTQPATNAQVALQCAVGILPHLEHTGANATTEIASVLLRWLNANTPAAPDQPGELA